MILWTILIIMILLLYLTSLVAVSYFYKGFNERFKDNTYIKTVAINFILSICIFIPVIYYGKFASSLSMPMLKNIIIVLLATDTLYYWIHSTSHYIPFIKKLMHSTHHKLVGLLPLDTFYLDSLDNIIFSILILYFPLLIVNNGIEYIILLIISMIHSVYLHSDISTSFILPMFIDAKFHSLHHSVGLGNYSIFFPFWDDYMGTRIKDIVVEKTGTIITMDEFNTMCKSGRKLTIINKQVIDCEKWINTHPGGKAVIEKLIGKDSTKEFNAVHGDSSVAKEMLKTLKILDLEDKTT